MDHWTLDLMWWVSAVELPVLAGLFWLIWHTRHDFDSRTDELDHRIDSGLVAVREALAAYKLEVAKSYASTGYLKDVERRLSEHLVRIEAKLDAATRS